MEGLAPILRLALQIRLGIERGDSVRFALKNYLATTNDDISKIVAQWLALRDRGVNTFETVIQLKSPHRRAVLEVLEKSLIGESILPQLVLLEEDLRVACLDELDQKIALLPFKALVPLMLFQFPALLILLFSPLLGQLLREF